MKRLLSFIANLLCVLSVAILSSCEPTITSDAAPDTEETPDSGSNSDKDEDVKNDDEPTTGDTPSTDDKPSGSETPGDTPGGDDNTGNNGTTDDEEKPSTGDTPGTTVDHSYTYWNKCTTQTTSYNPDGTSVVSNTESRRTYDGFKVMSEETYLSGTLYTKATYKYDGLIQVSTTTYPSMSGYSFVQTTTYKEDTFLYPLTVVADASRVVYTYDNQGRQTSYKSYSNGQLLAESATTYQGTSGERVSITYVYGTTEVAVKTIETIQYLDASCKDVKSSETSIYTASTGMVEKYQVNNSYQNNRMTKVEQYYVQNSGKRILYYSSVISYSTRHKKVDVSDYALPANANYQLGALISTSHTEYDYVY